MGKSGKQLYQYKMHMRRVHQLWRKKQESRQEPYENKVECDIENMKVWGNLTLDYADISYEFDITKTRETSKGTRIIQIKCPHCGRNMSYDRRWGAFICRSKKHKKTIVELCPKHFIIPEQKIRTIHEAATLLLHEMNTRGINI